MIQGSFILLAAAAFLAVAEGRREEGLWRYRGIRRILRECRKKGIKIPEWLEEKMILRTWLLLFLGSTFLNIWGIAEMFAGDGQVTRLKRPEFGQGTVQEELNLEWEEEDGTRGSEEMLVEVKEKNLTKEEKEEVFCQVKKELDHLVLGENLSADHVDQPLYFPERLDGYPAVLTWNSSDPAVVDWEGTLGKEIPKEGTLVCLTAVIRIGETEENYFQYVRVFPPEKQPGEELEEALAKANQDAQTEWMELPGELQKRKLFWKKSRSGTANGVGLLVFLCPVLLLLRDKQAAEEKKKRERRQMMQDYPEILSKLTLLLGAGVNLRRAMERIGQDYVNYTRDREKRKAYEVILEICREMDRGISEKQAYERLGERCEMMSYRTLSALLVQHLQKGSRGMERMLEEEAQKAQEMRQQQARVLGEQASAKLLVPMILMLLVVFAILMIPAWLTFIM